MNSGRKNKLYLVSEQFPVVMVKNILCGLIFLYALSVYAERVIKREKYSIVIPFDTLYSNEDYNLYVELGNAKNVEVKRNGCVVPIISGNRGHVKFKSSAAFYDEAGRSVQQLSLSIKINNKVFNETVPYVVTKLPIKAYSVQDSVSIFLSKDSVYKKVRTFDNVFIYDDFIKYLKKNLPVETSTGQLAVAIIINTEGHVERYDWLKNSYTGISKEELDKVILSYYVVDYMLSKGRFKFGIEAITFQGHPDPIFYGHGFIMK